MLDIRKFCQSNHVPFVESGHHHCRPGWVQLNCPFCAGGQSGWHLGFNLTRGNFVCWKCGGLKFWGVIQALLRVGAGEAKSAVRECQTGVSSTIRLAPPPAPLVRKRHLKEPPGCGPLLPPHKRYLESRKFDPKALVARWDLRGTDHTGGRWSWRIIIPICNEEGRVVAYQGRAIGDVDPKYRMTDDADCLESPEGLLYGLNQVDGDSVIVVEGVPSVWRLGPGAVATFGIKWRKAQANRLRRFKKRYLLFDPEPDAQRKARELARYLSLFPGTTEVLSGFETDPGEFSPRKVRRIRQELGFPV